MMWWPKDLSPGAIFYAFIELGLGIAFIAGL
jgi:hypothetical protein